MVACLLLFLSRVFLLSSPFSPEYAYMAFTLPLLGNTRRNTSGLASPSQCWLTKPCDTQHSPSHTVKDDSSSYKMSYGSIQNTFTLHTSRTLLNVPTTFIHHCNRLQETIPCPSQHLIFRSKWSFCSLSMIEETLSLDLNCSKAVLRQRSTSAKLL